MNNTSDQQILIPTLPPSLEDILRLMHDHNGSDAYVSAGAPVKIKINGKQVCVTERAISSDEITEIITSLDSDQLTELDKSHELNCVISISGIGRFRISVFCQRNSKALVARYIPFDIPDIDTLRLPAKLKDLALLKRGLILIVGPTGSGKTTTLASMINHRNIVCNDHIITIEDPIEFLFKHQGSIVNQREIGADTNSYSEALKNAMRQSPDVILVGEIRDKETMSLAMHYAQSGHLCLATLHADNSYQAINRVVGFYDPAHRDALFQDLSGSLQAIVAQRLVPSTDGKRIPAVEVLVTSAHIQELIAAGDIRNIPEAMGRSLASGTSRFEDQLLEFVKLKKITVENALLFSDSASNLYWRLANENLHIDSSTAMIAGVSQELIQRYESTKLPPEGITKKDPFSNISIDPNRI